jgi:hypothetical protein
MEVTKAGIVDQSHPVFLALPHVDAGPGHILRAIGGVGRSRTAAAPTIDGAGVGDWLVASSIIRLLGKGSQRRGTLRGVAARFRLTEKNSLRRIEEGL